MTRASPFKWTETADEILAKVKRLGQAPVSSPRWPQMTNDFLKKSKIKGTRVSASNLTAPVA